ncbi:MAG: protein kinase [Desulfovibrionaceae bacterium]|nr:protein kinase [Desulfovibrionaceae bacterium]
MRFVGKYRILGLLGRGGMGVVYKALAPVTGRVVAVKVLRPAEMLAALWGPEALRERFQAEAAVLGSVSHPNLLDVWDFGEDAGQPFFVMDYHCDDLGRLLGEGYRVEAPCRRLPARRAFRLGDQLLAGLSRLHFAGVVHRDIKPYNLLLTEDDVVKITDFGLSKARGERFETPRGLNVGSPYYCPPEQEADPQCADARSDLYAAGVTLFRMLTGHLPVDEAGRRPVPSSLDAEFGESFDAFFEMAVHPDPAGRFPDAFAMREALAGLSRDYEAGLARTCALLDEGPGPERPERPERPEGPEGPDAAGRGRPENAGRAVGPAGGGGACDHVRRRPEKIALKAARERFGLDPLWRPVRYACPETPVGRFTDLGDGAVRDTATGLAWQRGGALFPVCYPGAQAYVEGLCRTGWAGRIDWRLPTMDELLSLLGPVKKGAAHCADPVFDPAVRRVWSADRRTFTAAWMADLEMGFVTSGDFTCPCGVRAVAG